MFGLAGLATATQAADWKFNNGLPETRNEAKQLDMSPMTSPSSATAA